MISEPVPEPLRINRADGRDGQRYAVLAVQTPAGADPAMTSRIVETILQPTPEGIQWMLQAGCYVRHPLAGVSPDHPPQRPLGDLIVDLYSGQTFRILHERAIPTPVVVETRVLAVQLH